MKNFELNWKVRYHYHRNLVFLSGFKLYNYSLIRNLTYKQSKSVKETKIEFIGLRALDIAHKHALYTCTSLIINILLLNLCYSDVVSFCTTR